MAVRYIILQSADLIYDGEFPAIFSVMPPAKKVRCDHMVASIKLHESQHGRRTLQSGHLSAQC